MSLHTISVLVEDKPGVLTRVAGMFAARGFNIDSLAVGPTEHPEVSRMTVVVDVEELPLEQVTKQLNKLVEVIKVAIINNSSLGMVRQWQTLFYNERYSNTDLHTSVGSRVPDFVKLADAYGCAGFRCERPEDVDDTIRAAMAVNDRPVVVDFVVHRDAMVWPMVQAGVSNDLIQVARDTAPQWDREESEAVEQGLDPDHDGVPTGSHAS